jgi:hypothetical protein
MPRPRYRRRGVHRPVAMARSTRFGQRTVDDPPHLVEAHTSASAQHNFQPAPYRKSAHTMQSPTGASPRGVGAVWCRAGHGFPAADAPHVRRDGVGLFRRLCDSSPLPM